jgi:hypothetical protein
LNHIRCCDIWPEWQNISARSCPRCNGYVGIVLPEPGRNTSLQAVNGRCLQYSYRLAWIVIRGKRDTPRGLECEHRLKVEMESHSDGGSKNKLQRRKGMPKIYLARLIGRSACFRASLPNLGRFPVFLADVNAAPVWHVAAMAAVELLRNGIVTYRAATPIVLYVSHR